MYESQRSIVRRLFESKQNGPAFLNEAWHPVLNQLRDMDKKILRRTLINAGIDIENTASNSIKVVSNRDPRLKGKGVVIIDFGAGYVGVWMDGKAIVDTELPQFDYRLASRQSWKSLLDTAKQIYYMEYDETSVNALKQKQDDRKESKPSQSVTRYTRATKPKGTNGMYLDKSGYLVDINKYKNMLADLKLNDASRVLSDAKNVYVQLANKLDSVDFENDGLWDNYGNIMLQIQKYFADLKRYNAEYEKVKSKSDNVSEFQMKWVKSQVTEAIKGLRDYMVKAKKYL